ncbi:MAG: methyltransferase domain-containing protein [Candidatus Omnitrophica bacterium]|nr:methyltransferase domain-containing protein [Candidatus Omnitrophota bacterium]
MRDFLRGKNIDLEVCATENTINIFSKGATKRIAMNILASEFGVAENEIVTVGDNGKPGGNDHVMLERVFGCCVGNYSSPSALQVSTLRALGFKGVEASMWLMDNLHFVGVEDGLDDPDCKSWTRFWDRGEFSTMLKIEDEMIDFFVRSLYPIGMQGEEVKILDIGAGNLFVPEILKQMKEREGLNFDITAIDPADIKVEKEGVKFHRRRAKNTGFRSNSFDVLTGCHFLEYTKREEALREMNRVLKNGGEGFFVLHHTNSRYINYQRAHARALEKFLRLNILDMLSEYVGTKDPKTLEKIIELKESFTEKTEQELFVYVDELIKLIKMGIKDDDLPGVSIKQRILEAKENLKVDLSQIRYLLDSGNIFESEEQIVEMFSRYGFEVEGVDLSLSFNLDPNDREESGEDLMDRFEIDPKKLLKNPAARENIEDYLMGWKLHVKKIKDINSANDLEQTSSFNKTLTMQFDEVNPAGVTGGTDADGAITTVTTEIGVPEKTAQPAYNAVKEAELAKLDRLLAGNFRAIVFDIDWTLTGARSREVPDEVIDKIVELINRGVFVTLISGRAQKLPPEEKQKGFPDVDEVAEKIRSKLSDKSKLGYLLCFGEDGAVGSNGFVEGDPERIDFDLEIENMDDGVRQVLRGEIQRLAPELECYPQAKSCGVSMQVIAKYRGTERLYEVAEQMRDALEKKGFDLEVCATEGSINIFSKGATKLNAIKILTSEFGISEEEIVTAGDNGKPGGNDHSLVERVFGCCVGDYCSADALQVSNPTACGLRGMEASMWLMNNLHFVGVEDGLDSLLYNTWTEFWKEGGRSTMDFPDKNIFDFFSNAFDPYMWQQRKLRVLDVGSGNFLVADTVKEIAKHKRANVDITAIDPADIRIKQKGIKFYRRRAENTGFRSNSFDIVAGCHFLEYSNAGGSLREINRILKEGGEGFFVLHHPNSKYVEYHQVYNKVIENILQRRLLSMLVDYINTKDPEILEDINIWKGVVCGEKDNYIAETFLEHINEVLAWGNGDGKWWQYSSQKMKEMVLAWEEQIAGDLLMAKNLTDGKSVLAESDRIKELFSQFGFEIEELDVLSEYDRVYMPSQILGWKLRVKKVKDLLQQELRGKEEQSRIQPEPVLKKELPKTPNVKAYSEFIEKNTDLMVTLLNDTVEPVLLRVPVEKIETADKENIENMRAFLNTFQEAENGYVELYYMSGTRKLTQLEQNDLHEKYRIKQKPLKKGFKSTTENTVSLFTLLKARDFEISSDPVQAKKDIHRLLTTNLGYLPPDETQVVPIGLQNDPVGLVRATIVGVQLLHVARYKKFKEETGEQVDDRFVKEFIDPAATEYENLLNALGVKGGSFGAQDILNLAAGDIMTRIRALKKLIDLIPMMPINTEEQVEIFELAHKALKDA